MNLSEQQADQVANYLRKTNIGRGDCKICGDAADWAVRRNLVRIPPAGESTGAAGRIEPFILVTCRGCGHTLLFDAENCGIELPALVGSS